MAYFIVGAVIGLVISGIAAGKFNEIAQMKGHNGYFWWCFWLGIIGWIMVAALPDRRNLAHSQNSKDNTDDLPEL